jgi:hypothetical protein
MQPFYPNAESINLMDLKEEILGSAEPICSSEMTDRSCIWEAKMKFVRFLAKGCGLKLLVGEDLGNLDFFKF